MISHLSNQWLIFNQTCIDIFLGGGKELTFTLFSRSHQYFEMSNLNFDKNRVSARYLLNLSMDSGESLHIVSSPEPLAHGELL